MKKLILITLLFVSSFSVFANEAQLGERQEVTCDKLDQSSRDAKADSAATDVSADTIRSSETTSK